MLKTNKQKKKQKIFFSSSGSVPAALIGETVFEHVARALNKHPIILKELNLYEADQVFIPLHNSEKVVELLHTNMHPMKPTHMH